MSGDPISIPGMISVQLFENSSGEQVEGATQYTVNRWLVAGGMVLVVRIMQPLFAAISSTQETIYTSHS